MFKTLAGSVFSKTEMPEYSVVSSNEVYEERVYVESKWAVTRVTGKVYKESSSEGFTRLFKYIAGTNKEGKNVPMTSPVCIHITPADEWKTCVQNFGVGFFIPPGEHTENPPTPNEDSMITIRSTPKTHVYVRQFTGFAGEPEIVEELKKLRDALGSDHPYVEEFYYFCGYDSPMKLINRRNEVWLLKKESK
ncbi:heme-binding protein 1-like [Amphiura filiformis]|uniref:heme-binding protein 1-like n=1 Tax=Amphiura filiformis TaxID=82378 RepID=UPI003B21DACD